MSPPATKAQFEATKVSHEMPVSLNPIRAFVSGFNTCSRCWAPATYTWSSA